MKQISTDTLGGRLRVIRIDFPGGKQSQKEIAEKTNKEQIHGDLKTAMKGRDIFVGVSAPNIVTAEMVSTMADDAIVFAMVNPTPEIMPDEARKGGARI